jgi:hypothetical protein
LPPPIAANPGPGFQIVAGTFQHEAAQTLDISVEDELKPIGTTPNHPIWSVDREAFVRADSLTVGERLQTLNGIARIINITARGPPEPVYNLEVQVKHTYFVADSGVLVHNGGLCAVGKGGRDTSAFGGMTLTGKTRSGLPRLDDKWRSLYGPGVNRRHHLVPQEMLKNQKFVKQLKSLGYNTDEIKTFINRQISDIPNMTHMRIHAEGWNRVWKDWLRQNPDFSVSDRRSQIKSMMKEFDIPRSSLGGPQYGR